MSPKLESLFSRGKDRVKAFCEANDLLVPPITDVPQANWRVNACAYYRPSYIKICLPWCAHPAGEALNRNWNWPGSTVDRTPYGVVCHELGHHLDWTIGGAKGKYWSNYCTQVRKEAKEPPISGYCPDDTEWFAEMARLFVTNHALLYLLRPRTWDLLLDKFTPVSHNDWRIELGRGVPDRVLKALVNKMKP